MLVAFGDAAEARERIGYPAFPARAHQRRGALGEHRLQLQRLAQEPDCLGIGRDRQGAPAALLEVVKCAFGSTAAPKMQCKRAEMLFDEFPVAPEQLFDRVSDRRV